MQIQGKVAFVTGAASGIGLAMARALGEGGMQVVLGDVEQPALDAAVVSLQQQGIEAAGHVLDVTDRGQVLHAADAVREIFGGVHVLCNNAGVNAAGPADQLTFADWDWVLGVNLMGVVNCLVGFMPELKRHPGAAYIVNTASVGGLVGMRNLAPYNASKFGVVGLSEALRADLEPMGIGVSVLCPGVVRTNLGTSERNRPGAEPADASQPVGAEPQAPSPLRVIEPDEVGREVRDAILSERFFICTHPEFYQVVRQRHAALEAALDGNGSRDALLAAPTADMVRPFG